jgi:tellurite methyltransferase
MDMFSPEGHCLFKPGELRAHLAGWEILGEAREEFAAPHGTLKAFETVIARKPA